MYNSPLPIVAAINNHAITAGCVLATACDRRVMVKGTIGQNAVKLGFTLPIWLCERFIDLVGKNEGDFACQFRYLYNPEEALKIGLVDNLSTEEDLLITAKEELQKFLSVPNFAFAATKSASICDNIKNHHKQGKRC